MKNKILSSILLAVFAFLVPLTVSADSRKYSPPAKRGNIYVVIRYKAYNSRDLGLKSSTTVNLNWGGYKRKSEISRPGFDVQAQGFVLKLGHSKDDTVELTIETDGTILNGPYQGDPPSEWNDGKYKRVEW